MLTPSPYGFEEKLQNLDVTFRLVEGRSPRIQSVAANQERMRRRVLGKLRTDHRRQPPHVLVVLDDGHPFAMLVGPDTVEALEHLVALNRQATRAAMEI
jgi:hypothetical protein